jgi:hypothetical protein
VKHPTHFPPLLLENANVEVAFRKNYHPVVQAWERERQRKREKVDVTFSSSGLTRRRCNYGEDTACLYAS